MQVWILIEGKNYPEKMNIEDPKSDLYDLAERIVNEKIIDNVELNLTENNLTFYKLDNKTQSLAKNILIKDCVISFKDPLLVRYCISKSEVDVQVCFEGKKILQKVYTHDSGLWYCIRKDIQENLEYATPGTGYWFIVKGYSIIIQDEKDLLNAVKKSLLENQVLKLSLVFEDRKAFTEYDLNDAFRVIFNEDSDSRSIQKFNLDELGKLKEEIKEENYLALSQEMNRRKDAIEMDPLTIESRREFISPFLIAAVLHFKKLNLSVSLEPEAPLNGSKAYGIIDYVIRLGKTIILVTEVKRDDWKKGIAQAFMQMYTALELHNVRKRKLEDEENSVFGIVTDVVGWHFYRYSQDRAGPRIEKLVKYLGFYDEKNLKKDCGEILEIIVKIIQSKISKQSNDSKRYCQAK